MNTNRAKIKMWTRPPSSNQSAKNIGSAVGSSVGSTVGNNVGNTERVHVADPSYYTQQNTKSVKRPNLDSELQLYMGSKQHKDLMENMKGAMRARHYAHSRLEQKHKVSIFTLSIISLFVVGISLYALTYSSILPIATKSAITFASIISSIFIIIVGLLESQNNYQVRALQMKKCAQEINDLYQRLQIENVVSKDTLQFYTEKYHMIMQACPYNYDDIDYMMAKMEGKRAEDIGWETKIHYNVMYFVNVYGLSSVIILIPPMILFML